MRLEELGEEIAHQLVRVAPFDERKPFGDQRLELDRADIRAVLLALRSLLRLFVGVELTIDPSGHAVEDVGQGPEQILELRLEAGGHRETAFYARYSCDNQRDAPIADQFRVCRLHAEKQGWQVEESADHAISGASLLRPGDQALITDALRGRLQIVLAEAMDRLLGDQEDIAGLYKRMAYADVQIVTLMPNAAPAF